MEVYKCRRRHKHRKGVFMKKKIAFVLILVLLVNCFAWADNNLQTTGRILMITGLSLMAIGGIIAIIVRSSSEADGSDESASDSSDNNIRLTSIQQEELQPQKNIDSLFNIFKHVDIGQTQKDKIYMGLRFQF